MKLQRNVRTFHRFSLVLVVLQAGIVTACATSRPLPPVTFNSKTYDGGATVSRMLVLAGPKDQTRMEDLYGPLSVPFPSRIEALLAQCHVESRAFRQDGPPTVEESHASEAQTQLRPDAILTIRALGGQVVEVYDSGAVRLEGHRFFELKLVSAESSQPIWIARARYDYQGMNLATAIVTQLRADGVLKGCPPGELVIPRGHAGVAWAVRAAN